MKRDTRELLDVIAAFLALPVITVLVAKAVTTGLDTLGIATTISVHPFISNDGEEVSESLTAAGYSAILFGISIAVYCIMIWFEPKPTGWIFGSSMAGAALVIAWLCLAVSGLLLDTIFGYEDGFHQGVASAIWLILGCFWVYAVYRILNWMHRFLNLDSATSPLRKSDESKNF